MKHIFEKEEKGKDQQAKPETTPKPPAPPEKLAAKGRLQVMPSQVTARDGAYYVLHTLVGARNANLLTLSTDVQVGAEGGAVIVKVLDKGNGAVKKGTVGRGGVKKELKKAEMLSVADPTKLMANLKVSNPAPASETNDIKKILLILRQAIYNTEAMTQAFVGVKELK